MDEDVLSESARDPDGISWPVKQDFGCAHCHITPPARAVMIPVMTAIKDVMLQQAQHDADSLQSWRNYMSEDRSPRHPKLVEG